MEKLEPEERKLQAERGLQSAKAAFRRGKRRPIFSRFAPMPLQKSDGFHG